MAAGLGPMQKALVNAGLAEAPKQRPHRGKEFKCKRCKQPMIKVPDSNIMYCSNEKCNNYFLFSQVM